MAVNLGKVYSVAEALQAVKRGPLRGAAMVAAVDAALSGLNAKEVNGVAREVAYVRSGLSGRKSRGWIIKAIDSFQASRDRVAEIMAL
jgi:hypothetical protein